MIRTCLTLILTFVSTSVLAYNLEVRSDSPLVTESELRGMVKTTGEAVRHNIPETQEVYVYVITRAKPRDNDPAKYIFFHRAELRRHFTSTDPYTFNGWLPIKQEEFYGVDDANGVKASLDSTLRRFFSEVKNLNVTVKTK